jgi:hypothetical protein
LATELLTPFWIVPPDRRGPLGLGVTAHSLEDALAIIRAAGFGAFLPEDAALLQITEAARYADLPEHVQKRMGPIVVRGVWYPFVRVGT